MGRPECPTWGTNGRRWRVPKGAGRDASEPQESTMFRESWLLGPGDSFPAPLPHHVFLQDTSVWQEESKNSSSPRTIRRGPKNALIITVLMNFSQFIVIVDIQVLRLIRTTGQNYDQNLTSTVLGLSSQFPPAPNFEGGGCIQRSLWWREERAWRWEVLQVGNGPPALLQLFNNHKLFLWVQLEIGRYSC